MGILDVSSERRGDLGDIFAEIRTRHREACRDNNIHGISVLILPATDHDGVTSCQTMENLLRVHSIKYMVAPLTSYRRLEEFMKDASQNNPCFRSIVCLNCCGVIPMLETMHQAEIPDKVKCYIVDAKRPFHLSNVHAPDSRVLCLDDRISSIHEVDIPSDDEVSEEDGEELSEDADEGAEDPDDTGVTAQDSTGDDSLNKLKRKREAKMRRRDRAKKRRRIQEYYQREYVSQPAAVTMYLMAHHMSYHVVDTLWWAAISAAGYFELGLISKDLYDFLVHDLKGWLAELQPESLGVPTQGQAPDSRPDGSQDAEEDAPFDHNAAPRTSVLHSRPVLRVTQDVGFPLYRHWKLREAMFHTDLLYSFFRLDRADNAERELENVLSRANLKPRDFETNLLSITIDASDTLHMKIRRVLESYCQMDSTYVSVLYGDQFRKPMSGEHKSATSLNSLEQEISASDMFHCLVALQEKNSLELEDEAVDLAMRREHSNLDNFWACADALVGTNNGRTTFELVSEGIALAIRRRQMIVDQAKRLLQKSGRIQPGPGKDLRYAVVEEDIPHEMRQPVAMRQLANLLMEHKNMNNPQMRVPFFLSVRDAPAGTYLCLGVTPATGMEADNDFPDRYDRASDGIRASSQAFYRSLIEVFGEDFKKFHSDIVRQDFAGEFA
mmetsp:Transcript_54703/g.119941  ORF Transcript_54703/g.119941 Transcript_54703/m.119941 type:complete len:667 (+) Transcript_54703:38-2038(+)